MYYTIVLVIATILLIVLLTIVGMIITAKKTTPFPEFQNICPDYWTLAENACFPNEFGVNIPASDKFKGGKAAPILHAGVKLNSEKKPSEILYIDLEKSYWYGLCDKAKWSKKNGLIWDGVTNNNTC